MSEDDSKDGEGSICTGWVVCRSLTQFQDLHKKLRPVCSEIRNLELPSSTFKFLFGKTDKATLEKAKQQIQRYLDVREIFLISITCELQFLLSG